MSTRVALPEDFDFDPTYRRQRIAASALLGIAINMARGVGHLREPNTRDDRMKQIDAIEMAAIELGIIHFDDYHHAPLCPANHWHKARMPTGPCSCGAEAAHLHSRGGQ